MKMSRTLKSYLPLSFAIPALLIFLVGCGNNSGPVDSLYQQVQGGKLPQQLERVLEPTKDGSTVSQFVDATQGGTIDFELCEALHQFIVRPNSIPASCVIEISARLDTGKGNGVLFLEFRPAGLQFAPHANLIIDAAAVFGKKASLGLWWYNPVTAKWELQERASVNNGKAPFRIYHFSKYAIS